MAGKSATTFLRTFAAKGAAKWFKHAKVTDLATVKIYDRVRDRLNVNFNKQFIFRLNGTISKNDAAAAFVDYAALDKYNKRVWT